MPSEATGMEGPQGKKGTRNPGGTKLLPLGKTTPWFVATALFPPQTTW